MLRLDGKISEMIKDEITKCDSFFLLYCKNKERIEKMDNLGFIGAGNMGYAMLKGASGVLDHNALLYTDVSKERLEEVKENTGIAYVDSNVALIQQAKYVVLAVKPQYLDGVLQEVKDYITEEHVIIAIAPGIAISHYKEYFGENCKVVRAMPNTPALVNEGMSGICFSEDPFTEQEKEMVYTFFGSFGKYEVVSESLMNAVVCASGSSPAYVYMFIEALADSAVMYGIPRDKAYTFAAQTVLGSAKMVLETGEHPGKLKDQVCSPGGTTIAAVAALEECGFRSSLMKAAEACYEKSTSFKK